MANNSEVRDIFVPKVGWTTCMDSCARVSYDERKVQAREDLFAQTGEYGLVPNATFDRTRFPDEVAFTAEEIISREYEGIVANSSKFPDRFSTLEDLFDRNDNGPTIIGNKHSGLAPHHLMIVHPNHPQHELTLASMLIGNEIVDATNAVIWLNGIGNNNSKGNADDGNHWQIYDRRRYHFGRRNDFRESFSIFEADTVYQQLLSEARLVTPVLLGRQRVGFMEQIIPFRQSLILPTQGTYGYPLPIRVDPSTLTREELAEVHLRFALGLAGAETATDDRMVVLKPGITSIQHYYECKHRMSKPFETGATPANICRGLALELVG